MITVRVWPLKRWFNRRWPYYRLCLHPWCWRTQVNSFRCPKHWTG